MKHSAIQLVSHTDIDYLFEQLLADYQQQKNHFSLFDEYTIAVPNQSVKNWLKAQMVKHTKLCSGFRFVSLHAFSNDVFKKSIGKGINVINKHQLSAVLYKILSGLSAQSTEGTSLDVLSRWMSAQQEAQSLVQLSHALADTFDLYQMYRSDWLDAWANNQCVLQTEAEQWQAALWRLICAELPETMAGHRNELMETLAESMVTADIQGPSQLAIFGFNQLHETTLKQLEMLSQRVSITLFWQASAQDLFGAGDEFEQNKQNTIKQAAYFAGNPLLASWGHLAREQALVLERSGITIDEQPLCDQPNHQTNQDILSQLQSRVMNNSATPLTAQDELDQSLTFSAHYSHHREVEGLYDYLLDQFNQNPGLKPDDIIVLCPDINAYSPYVNAVFDNQPAEKRLPFQLCGDVTSAGDVASLMTILIDMPTTRYELDWVMDLISQPLVKRRFALNADEVDLIKGWLTQANACWGLDKVSLKQSALPEYDRYTLQSAVNRLVIGMCLDGDALAVSDDILYGVEGMSALESDTLSKLVSLIDGLVTWRDICLDAKGEDKSYAVATWITTLSELTNRWIDVPQKEADQLNAWYRLLANLEQSFLDAEQQYGYAFIRSQLSTLVEERAQAAHAYRFGRVNIGSFGALKSIPAKIIAILGLNEADFPRKPSADSISLLEKAPRLGDRSQIQQDKDAFLMALMSAKSKLYCSFIGNNIRTNAERIPSVVLQELLDALNPDGDHQKQLIHRHPMKSYSDVYFKAENSLFTYQDFAQGDDLLPALVSLHDKPADLQPWDMPDQITIDMLRAFLEDPAKAFFKTRFQIDLPDVPEQNDNDEPFAASTLTKWNFIEQLLQQGVEEGQITTDMVDALALPYKASGAMEHDDMATKTLSDWGETAIKVLENISHAKGQKAPVMEPVDIDLNVDGQSVALVGDLPVFTDGAATDVIQWVHKEGGEVSEKYLMRTILSTRIAETLTQENKMNLGKSYLACKDKLYQLQADSHSGKNALTTWLESYKSVMNAPIALDLKSASGIKNGNVYRDAFNQVLENMQLSYSKQSLSKAMMLLCSDEEAVNRSEIFLKQYQYLKPGKTSEDESMPSWFEIKEGEPA